MENGYRRKMPDRGRGSGESSSNHKEVLNPPFGLARRHYSLIDIRIRFISTNYVRLFDHNASKLLKLVFKSPAYICEVALCLAFRKGLG